MGSQLSLEQVSRELAAAVPREESFQEAALTAMRLLRSAVPCDSINMGTIDMATEEGCHFALDGFLMPSNRVQLLPRFKRQNPMINYAREHGLNPPLRFTDFQTRRQFEETGIYRECYRDYTHSMVTFGVQHTAEINVSFVLSRSDRDFTDRECKTLSILQPLLTTLFRNHLLETVLRARHLAGRTVGIIVGRNDDVQWMDHMGAVFWERLRNGSSATRIPPVVRSLFKQPSREAQPLDQAENGEELWAQVQKMQYGWVLSLWVEDHGLERRQLSQLGLTSRQIEVLCWVAAGKTNSEIGQILGISMRTVQKHLETIYRQLGVETRLAAIHRCREIRHHTMNDSFYTL